MSGTQAIEAKRRGRKVATFADTLTLRSGALPIETVGTAEAFAWICDGARDDVATTGPRTMVRNPAELTTIMTALEVPSNEAKTFDTFATSRADGVRARIIVDPGFWTTRQAILDAAWEQVDAESQRYPSDRRAAPAPRSQPPAPASAPIARCTSAPRPPRTTVRLPITRRGFSGGISSRMDGKPDRPDWSLDEILRRRYTRAVRPPTTKPPHNPLHDQ